MIEICEFFKQKKFEEEKKYHIDICYLCISMIFFISGTGWRSRQTQTQTNIQTDIKLYRLNRILVELTLRCSLGGMFYLALPGFTIHSILYFYFSQVVRSKVKEHPGRGREPLSEPCSALPLC